MKIIFLLFFKSAFGLDPTLPYCHTVVFPNGYLALDCSLAEVSVREKQTVNNAIYLGTANYSVTMRFYIKNPRDFSRIVIQKPIMGAVEECSVQNLFNLTQAVRVLSSPSPGAGGKALKEIMENCMRNILAPRLMDEMVEDIVFLSERKNFQRGPQVKSPDWEDGP
jgi:hypothetical protein